MTLQVDPEIQAALAAAYGGHPPPPKAPVGDVAARRARFDGFYALVTPGLPVAGAVTATDHDVPGSGGHSIPVRYYVPTGERPSGAVIYLHGGGMIGGSLATHDRICRRYVADAKIGLLAVDYRLAPSHKAPAQAEDVYAALVWLAQRAGDWGIEPSRIGMSGDSSGGSLAVAASLLARERGGPDVALLMLVYPMLDDRTVGPDPRFGPYVTWTYEDNRTAWAAVLGDTAGGSSVSPFAAAARATDLSGLPRTYLEVGDLDIFCDETVAFAAALMRAGVPTELHVHQGAIHGFDIVAPDTVLGRRAHSDRIRVLASLL